MTARFWICASLAIVAIVAGGTVLADNSPADQEEYTIGPEDVLNISVWQNDQLTRTAPVRPDGKISLPLVNDVQAAGLTPMQLRDVIGKKLADRISVPEVSVIVVEVHSMKVSVIGEVERPGRYELRSQATVLDVLALAGGFKEFAATDRIFIVPRRRPGGAERIPFNYKSFVLSRGSQPNLSVYPGDVIVVP